MQRRNMKRYAEFIAEAMDKIPKNLVTPKSDTKIWKKRNKGKVGEFNEWVKKFVSGFNDELAPVYSIEGAIKDAYINNPDDERGPRTIDRIIKNMKEFEKDLKEIIQEGK